MCCVTKRVILKNLQNKSERPTAKPSSRALIFTRLIIGYYLQLMNVINKLDEYPLAISPKMAVDGRGRLLPLGAFFKKTKKKTEELVLGLYG